MDLDVCWRGVKATPLLGQEHRQEPFFPHLLHVAGGLGVTAHAALSHLGKVTQVEGVVTLGGRGQQLCPNGVVDLQRGRHQRLCGVLNGFVEVAPAVKVHAWQ